MADDPAAPAAADGRNTGRSAGHRSDDWLTGGMRGLVADAVAEAGTRGTTTVEAEHVLLAILSDASTPTAGILATGGLTHTAFSAALDLERHNSLAAVSARLPDPALLRSTPRLSKPTWGASVAAARSRAAGRPARTRRAAEPALAAGILAATLGTVPRALAYAGIDQRHLLELLDANPQP